jgi:hypothetical protein
VEDIACSSLEELITGGDEAIEWGMQMCEQLYQKVSARLRATNEQMAADYERRKDLAKMDVRFIFRAGD